MKESRHKNFENHRAQRLISIRLLFCFMTVSLTFFTCSVSSNLNSYPSTTSLRLAPISLKPVSVEELKPARQRLLEAAFDLAKKDFVPYALGGRKIGSASVCNSCKECIKSKKLLNKPSSKRLSQCKACQKCSIDCSHFVNHIFSKARVVYRFADTSTLFEKSKTELFELYRLNEISSDVSQALPGDLILEKGHIVMVMAVDVDKGKIDYVHSTRGSNDRLMGGIEMEVNVPMNRFYRREVQILRHQELMEPVFEATRWDIVAGIVKKLKLKFAFNS